MAEREGSVCNAMNIVCKQEGADMRLESGTCNVCSAPCSSCMHLNRALMGSKEFSDENCRLGEANQYSVDEGDGSFPKKGACERLKHDVGQMSNMPSVNSSHDSLSGNDESRQASSGMYQDSKCLEGLDDNISCTSRASNANLVNDSHQRNIVRINESCSSASVSHLGAAGGCGSGPSVDMSSLSEIHSSKDADIPEYSSECCVEKVNSSLSKEGAPIVVSDEKLLAGKDSLINGSDRVTSKVSPKSEVDTGSDVGNAKDPGHKNSVHGGLNGETKDLVKSPVMPQAQLEDESDESDLVEHDVKVCDICGDAGREDQLAICSRCSDGAEHIYCMREMLKKVPKGYWLCEECEYAEETENRRLDAERKKNHKVCSALQISGKRPSESVEVVTAAKRQALESSTGSPKPSSPKRTGQLSRESSFKSLDKGNVKPSHQIPFRNLPVGDDIEFTRSLSTGSRSQTAKSALLKSNSFKNFNSKPRVKLVDEVVPPRLKGGGELTSKNMEAPSRLISKSMSFKSPNLSRSSAAESKVKMLSSKPGTAQDMERLRHAKESGASDRKFLQRIDKNVVCSTMASSVVSTSKGNQKLTPRGETAKPSAVSINREFKVNQDGKISSSSKSMNSMSRKSLEPQVSSERTTTSVDETQQGGLPQLRETANQVDKTKDTFSDHVRSGVTSTSKGPLCHKCKDFGHPTECCTVGSTQEFGAEVSATAASSSKEEMDKGNRLKAAIQAALLRRPEIYKKKKVPDKTDELPTSGTDLSCEVTSQDQVLVSNAPNNSIAAEKSNARMETHDSSTLETSCSSANDLKQLSFCPAKFCSQPGNASGKPVVRDFSNQALVGSSFLSKMSVIPEYEFIWQGAFKVHRSGKPPDFYSGIQAHLSNCASPKVPEVVNRFLPEVSLDEVSRLSTWPLQFHQSGAKEENIALYFFARDIESYERHYRGLLDHMIRNDLALKGIFDGVELLIFPSNQLPEYSQRWNMLLFLWGVFRGRRSNHSVSAQKIPSLNVMAIEKDFPTAAMTLSETRCLPKCMDEESVICRKASSLLLSSTSVDQGHIMKDNVLEHGQNKDSLTPEAVATSLSSRTVETKINDICVKQENSLSSVTPSVGNQEVGAASNVSKDKISERTKSNEDHQRPKRKQIENDLNINIEATSQGDLIVKGVNCQLPIDKKVQRIDLSDPIMQHPKMPWNEVNGKSEDGEGCSKKLKSGLSGSYGCSSSGGRGPFNQSFTSLANDPGLFSTAENKGCKEGCEEKIIEEDLGSMERTFFPVVNAHNKNDSPLVLSSMSLNGPHEFEEQSQVGSPNLELALGGKSKPPHKGMLPFFVGPADKKNNQEKPLNESAADEEREDDSVAASLSLSLSFPSSKEHTKPVLKDEQLPDGHDVNTSFLLFGRFPDK